MRVDLLTLFPEMMSAVLGTSIPKRAAEKGAVSYHYTNIRDFATDVHGSVDDKPFGGGPGMVMMCQTLFDAVEHAEKQQPEIAPVRIITTPHGKVLDQALVAQLAAKPRLLIICGHYEGIDQRVCDALQPMEISIGDYVLSGGELAALVLVDAIVRTLPGVLGAQNGAADESFADGLLEHPQYTRPRDFRGLQVPDVLTSGNHKLIEKWRLEQRKAITQQKRPDLWQAYLNRQ